MSGRVLPPQNSSCDSNAGRKNSHTDLDTGLGWEQAVPDLATHDFWGKIWKLIADISHRALVAIITIYEVKAECRNLDVLWVKEVASFGLFGRVWVDLSLLRRIVDCSKPRKVRCIVKIPLSCFRSKVSILPGIWNLKMIWLKLLNLFLRARIMRRICTIKLNSLSASWSALGTISRSLLDWQESIVWDVESPWGLVIAHIDLSLELRSAILVLHNISDWFVKGKRFYFDCFNWMHIFKSLFVN